MKENKKSLLRELKWTVIGLGTAMLVMCFLFYINVSNIIKKYTMQNMQQVSLQLIGTMDETFLQLEKISFTLSESKEVCSFLRTENALEFYGKAQEMETLLEGLVDDTKFMNHIILYNSKGKYYRFWGNISNPAVQKMMNVVNKTERSRYLQIKLDEVNYIGYVTPIYHGNDKVGKAVILMDEKDILRLFDQIVSNEKMKIAFVADGKIVVSNEAVAIGRTTGEFLQETEYAVHKKIGFTPFELLILYEDANYEINLFFFLAMIVAVGFLLVILKIFLHFWRKKFFEPVQTVISQVEAFESGRGENLQPTNMEHLDGLVKGINQMLQRIEGKQKALIISLKKQISAHFTVNVLNSIKALSGVGENEKAGLLCDGLSYLLRYANAGEHFINGMDEFFVLEKYAEVMKIRYPDNFEVDIVFDDKLESVEIPRMLLQPIVENSILHGMVGREKESGGMIRVYSIWTEEFFQIVVEDNGCGIKEKELEELRERIAGAEEIEIEEEGLSHIALLNIERRIVSYFGEKCGITLESREGGGTKVTVIFPLREGIK